MAGKVCIRYNFKFDCCVLLLTLSACYLELTTSKILQKRSAIEKASATRRKPKIAEEDTATEATGDQASLQPNKKLIDVKFSSLALMTTLLFMC